MTTPTVLVAHPHPAVTELTLNRPAVRNALSIEMMEDLFAAVDEAAADDNQRVLILRGAGPLFCAGLDLKEAMNEENADRSASLVARMLETVYLSRLVTIAAVHGAAVAGGAGLMSACDVVVAADDARISYPETHRGLVAGLVMQLLYRQVGDRRARELAVLGDWITAEQAHAIGLINYVVPTDRLKQKVGDVADLALKAGPNAVRRTKELLEEISPVSTREYLRRAVDHHLAARLSPEAKEGIKAFVEKRPPRWHDNYRQEDKT
jgi:methylglutaconyl-CoA hydratase